MLKNILVVVGVAGLCFLGIRRAQRNHAPETKKLKDGEEVKPENESGDVPNPSSVPDRGSKSPEQTARETKGFNDTGKVEPGNDSTSQVVDDRERQLQNLLGKWEEIQSQTLQDIEPYQQEILALKGIVEKFQDAQAADHILRLDEVLGKIQKKISELPKNEDPSHSISENESSNEQRGEGSNRSGNGSGDVPNPPSVPGDSSEQPNPTVTDGDSTPPALQTHLRIKVNERGVVDHQYLIELRDALSTIDASNRVPLEDLKQSLLTGIYMTILSEKYDYAQDKEVLVDSLVLLEDINKTIKTCGPNPSPIEVDVEDESVDAEQYFDEMQSKMIAKFLTYEIESCLDYKEMIQTLIADVRNKEKDNPALAEKLIGQAENLLLAIDAGLMKLVHIIFQDLQIELDVVRTSDDVEYIAEYLQYICALYYTLDKFQKNDQINNLKLQVGELAEVIDLTCQFEKLKSEINKHVTDKNSSKVKACMNDLEALLGKVKQELELQTNDEQCKKLLADAVEYKDGIVKSIVSYFKNEVLEFEDELKNISEYNKQDMFSFRDDVKELRDELKKSVNIDQTQNDQIRRLDAILTKIAKKIENLPPEKEDSSPAASPTRSRNPQLLVSPFSPDDERRANLQPIESESARKLNKWSTGGDKVENYNREFLR
jgi:hypothetical protein